MVIRFRRIRIQSYLLMETNEILRHLENRRGAVNRTRSSLEIDLSSQLRKQGGAEILSK